MSKRGWYEFGDPVDPSDFPLAIAKYIENGTLIKVSDGYKSGQAFDCFYVEGADGAHLTLYHGGGYDSWLEGNDDDLIPDPKAAAFFHSFVHGIARELGVEAYV